jgi:glycine/D-amino acid oxidase-like deaminating enzyme
LETWAKWGQFAKTVGVETYMLNSDEASSRGRFTGQRWKGGVWSPTDGIANPTLAAPAAAKAVMALGGTVHQGCAARGIETSGGAISAVVTEKGTIRTKIVIMAGGAWASSFMYQMGIRFPQASVRQSILAVSTAGLEVPKRSSANRWPSPSAGRCHTLTVSGRARVDPTLQFLRFAPEFLPMFMRRWRNLSPGGLEGLMAGHEGLALAAG